MRDTRSDGSRRLVSPVDTRPAEAHNRGNGSQEKKG
jgi:hypothetical protein